MRKFTFIFLSVLLIQGAKAQQLTLVESYGIASSMNFSPSNGDIDGTYLEGYLSGGQPIKYEMKYTDDFTKYGMFFLQLSPLLYEAWSKAGSLSYECEEISRDKYSWTKDCDSIHSRVFWMKESGCYLDSITLDESAVSYVRAKYGLFDNLSEGSRKEFKLTLLMRLSGGPDDGRVVGGFTFVLDNREKNGVEEVCTGIPSFSEGTLYSLSGIRDHLQRSGITIVRLGDGTVRKVISK